MLFTINFDQTRKLKQEEAAKDNALAESSAMTQTVGSNPAWAKKEGKVSSPMCEAIIWAHWVVSYWLTSTWLTRTPYSLEFCFCICIFCIFMFFL